MPVVTTPDGAFGLPLEDGKEAFVAGDPEAFAERVERLVKDEAVREQIREGGYAYLSLHHSLRVAQDVMRRVLGLA
jgi:glycosyltransferase involved in cell wall biosynthesis